MDLLEVKNISKTYGNGEAAVHALKDVSFSVPKGEFVAVVGASGCGKSTLFRLINRLEEPEEAKPPVPPEPVPAAPADDSTRTAPL